MQNVDGAQNVGAIRFERRLDCARHERLRGQVKYDIRFGKVEGSVQRVGIAEIDRKDAFGSIAGTARGQNVVTLGAQSFDEIRPDESARAGNQRAHRF